MIYTSLTDIYSLAASLSHFNVTLSAEEKHIFQFNDYSPFSQVSVVSDPGRRGQHNTLSPFPSPFRSPFRSPLRCSPFKNLGHATGHCALDLDCDDDDMNLGCFILMFDLILKQVTTFLMKNYKACF